MTADADDFQVPAFEAEPPLSSFAGASVSARGRPSCFARCPAWFWALVFPPPVIKAGSLRSRPDSCAVTPSDPSFPYRTRLGILATRLGSRAFRAPAAEKCSIASPCYCARAVTRDSHPRRSPAQSRLSNGRSSQSLLPAPSPPTTTQAQTLTLSRVQSTNLGLLFPNARGGLGAVLSAGAAHC